MSRNGAPSRELSPMLGAVDRPMWCDDFDMDLPKVIPDAKAQLGDMAGVELWTHGGETYGSLNHPCVWNHDDGLIAFFGFKSPRKPEVYWTNRPMVRCTFWEAVRDAWPHGLIMLVEGRAVLDTNALWPRFQRIMWDLRGWGEPKPAGVIARDKQAVRRALTDAAEKLRQAQAQASESPARDGATQKDPTPHPPVRPA